MIPSLCFTNTQLHQIDFRGKHDQDWRQLHVDYILLQHAFCDHCAQGEIMRGSTVLDDDLSWYDSITIRYITLNDAYNYCMVKISLSIFSIIWYDILLC